MQQHFAVILVVFAVMTPTLPATAALPIPNVPLRPSIDIHGDDEFDAAHGVQGGSGTAEDPFLIGDFRLLVAPEAFGLRLVGTRAHVLIRDVTVLGDEGLLADYAYCIEHDLIECDIPRAIDIDGAQNVTIRRLDVAEISNAVWAHAGAKHVAIEDSSLSIFPYWPYGEPINGAIVEDSSDISITNTSSNWAFTPFRFERSRDILVDGGYWNSYYYRPALIQVANATVRNARLESGLYVERSEGVSVIGNSLTNASAVVLVSSADHDIVFGTRSVLVCGNTFNSAIDGAFYLRGTADVLIAGNTVNRSKYHTTILDSDGVTLERNLIVRSAGGGAGGYDSSTSALAIHNNSFGIASGPFAFSTYAVRNSNISDNYWGSPTGPRPYGSGVNVTGSDPRPWLASPPDTSVDCSRLAPPPSTHQTTYVQKTTLVGPSAFVLRAKNPAGEALKVSVQHWVEGGGQVDAANLDFVFDRNDTIQQTYGSGDARPGTQDVTVDAAGLPDVHVEFLLGGGYGMGITLSCTNACDMGLLAISGASRGGHTTITRYSSVPLPDLTIAQGKAGFASFDTMQGGASARASVLGYGASAAQLRSMPVDIEHSLWGYAWYGWAGTSGGHNFTRSGPDGDLKMDRHDDFGGSPGHYEYKLSGAAVVGTAHAIGLWADVDFHGTFKTPP